MDSPAVKPYKKVLDRVIKHTGTSDPRKIVQHFNEDEAQESVGESSPVKSITQKMRSIKSQYGKAARNGDSSAVKSAREKRIKLEDMLAKRGK